MDNDGDVDLLVLNYDDPLRLYINHEGENRNWVKFKIAGIAPNHFAVGARVTIRTGSVWQTKQILAGGNGYLGQNELTVHFGLDDATVVDQVTVRWPGGPQRTLVDLPANQTHVVRPALSRRSNAAPTPVTRSL